MMRKLDQHFVPVTFFGLDFINAGVFSFFFVLFSFLSFLCCELGLIGTECLSVDVIVLASGSVLIPSEVALRVDTCRRSHRRGWAR